MWDYYVNRQQWVCRHITIIIVIVHILLGWSQDLLRRDPGKHGTLMWCCFNAGPASQTLAQHWNNIGSTSRVYRDMWGTSSQLGLCGNMDHRADTAVSWSMQNGYCTDTVAGHARILNNWVFWPVGLSQASGHRQMFLQRDIFPLAPL